MYHVGKRADVRRPESPVFSRTHTRKRRSKHMSAAVDHTGVSPKEPSPDTSGLGGHPRGLSTLFFTEMWERFSYYGMRALLILFMTAPLAAGGLGFDTAKAGPIYGLYTAGVYVVALPG